MNKNILFPFLLIILCVAVFSCSSPSEKNKNNAADSANVMTIARQTCSGQSYPCLERWHDYMIDVMYDSIRPSNESLHLIYNPFYVKANVLYDFMNKIKKEGIKLFPALVRNDVYFVIAGADSMNGISSDYILLNHTFYDQDLSNDAQLTEDSIKALIRNFQNSVLVNEPEDDTNHISMRKCRFICRDHIETLVSQNLPYSGQEQADSVWVKFEHGFVDARISFEVSRIIGLESLLSLNDTVLSWRGWTAIAGTLDNRWRMIIEHDTSAYDRNNFRGRFLDFNTGCPPYCSIE